MGGDDRDPRGRCQAARPRRAAPGGVVGLPARCYKSRRKEPPMSPSRVEKIFDEGLMALRKTRYNLAFDLFTEVMELEPEVPEAHYNRGLAAARLLKWDEAERNFSMALR